MTRALLAFLLLLACAITAFTSADVDCPIRAVWNRTPYNIQWYADDVGSFIPANGTDYVPVLEGDSQDAYFSVSPQSGIAVYNFALVKVGDHLLIQVSEFPGDTPTRPATWGELKARKW